MRQQMAYLAQQNQLLMNQVGVNAGMNGYQQSGQPVNQGPKPQEIDYDAFISKPGEVIHNLVAQQIAPLNTAIMQMTRRGLVENLVNMARNHPQVSQLWGHVGGPVTMMLNQIAQHRDPNVSDVEMAVRQAVGDLAVRGILPGVHQVQQTQQVQQAPQVVPPTMRPSVNPLPGQAANQLPQLRPLTENEERLRRNGRGMTQVQWLYHAGELSFEQAKQYDSNFAG